MKLSEIIKDPQAVIVCNNEGEAKRICEKLDLTGLKWASGTSYLEYVKVPVSDMGVSCFNPCLGLSGLYSSFKNNRCKMVPFAEVEFDCVDYGYRKGSCHLAEKLISSQKRTDTPTIDWEQRRYEIAKDIFSLYMVNNAACANHTVEHLSGAAVSYADKLIERLKGE